MALNEDYSSGVRSFVPSRASTGGGYEGYVAGTADRNDSELAFTNSPPADTRRTDACAFSTPARTQKAESRDAEVLFVFEK